jgi:hypothetical protein
MPQISEADRGRIASCLQLATDGATDGEKLAGLAGARRLLQRSGTSWGDLVCQRPPASQPVPRPWIDLADRCLRRPDCLTEWERNFVGDIRSFRQLSPKQATILARIANKIGLGENVP